MIKAVNISKKFSNNITVLADITLDIQIGEICLVHGVNGSGKSTLLKIIKNIILPDRGSVALDQEYENSDIELISQNCRSFFMNLSAYENLLFFSSIKKVLHSNFYSKTDNLLKAFGIYDKKNIPASNLSTGELKKLSVIRSLIMEPKLILFDEVTTFLDSKSKSSLFSIVNSLISDKMASVIWVTHDLKEAENFKEYKSLNLPETL